MSLVDKIFPDLSNVKKVLNYYDARYNEAMEDLVLNMKKYGEANSEQAELYARYSSYENELSILYEDMQHRTSVALAKAYEHLIKSSGRQYTEKQLAVLSEQNADLMKSKKACFEIKERLLLFGSVVDGFKQRGFTLRNLTTIRAGDFQNDYIFLDD
jgi:hypothetical protein